MPMHFSVAVSILGVIGLLLSGCGSRPTGGAVTPSELASFSDYHQRQAKTGERKGDLQQAWQHWRILATAEPANPRYQSQSERLRKQIDQRAAGHFKRGRDLLSQGRTKQARGEFLAVLVLDPTHKKAIQQLRRLTSQQMQRLEARKSVAVHLDTGMAGSAHGGNGLATDSSVAGNSGSAVQAGIGNADNKKPVRSSTVAAGDPEVREISQFRQLYRSGEYRELIDRAIRAGFRSAINEPLAGWLEQAYLRVAESIRVQKGPRASLEFIDSHPVYQGAPERNRAFSRKIRRAVAARLYADGKSLPDVDISRTINLWEQALQFDPGFSEVRFQLEKTYRKRNSDASANKQQ